MKDEIEEIMQDIARHFYGNADTNGDRSELNAGCCSTSFMDTKQTIDPELVAQMNEMLEPEPQEPVELTIDVYMCKQCERLQAVTHTEKCGCGHGEYWKGTATFLRNL